MALRGGRIRSTHHVVPMAMPMSMSMSMHIAAYVVVVVLGSGALATRVDLEDLLLALVHMIASCYSYSTVRMVFVWIANMRD